MPTTPDNTTRPEPEAKKKPTPATQNQPTYLAQTVQLLYGVGSESISPAMEEAFQKGEPQQLTIYEEKKSGPKNPTP
jgi:hypothetical protein